MFWNFYQQLTSEERRIPFIFDDFHFCPSRVIGHDMTENRIFTLCRTITWVVFLRMFWNFISCLPVRRGGSLSFLVGTISNVLVMEIGWTDVGSGGYILVSCAHSNTSLLRWKCHFRWWRIKATDLNKFPNSQIIRTLLEFYPTCMWSRKLFVEILTAIFVNHVTFANWCKMSLLHFIWLPFSYNLAKSNTFLHVSPKITEPDW